MAKRVLWMFNNKYLFENEASVFSEMGYEIYAPKTCRLHSGIVDDFISYEYDSSLSLDKKLFEQLNDSDLWNIDAISSVMKEINESFDLVILPYIPELIALFLHGFGRLIICRIVEDYDLVSLSDDLTKKHPELIMDIEKNSKKFTFVFQDYACVKNECEWVKNNSEIVPVKILPYSDKKNTTVHVGIYAPNVEYDEIKRKAYNAFKREYKGKKYTVIGKQLIMMSDYEHSDDCLDDDLNADEVNCVIWNSDNRYCIPVYLLRKICSDAAVLYCENSVLTDYFSENRKGGCCKTIELLHKKTKKIDKISAEQYKTIVNKNLDIDNKWKNVLIKNDYLSKQNKFCANIALVMPNAYTGGILDFTNRLAMAIKTQAVDEGDDISITVFYPQNEIFEKRDYFEPVRKYGVKVTDFIWEKKDRKTMEAFFKLKGIPCDILEDDTYVINDGISKLIDYDYIIFTADTFKLPMYVPTRYSAVVHDVIDRVIPWRSKEIEEKVAYFDRRGEKAIVTTVPTKDAVITHLGTKKNKVLYMPQLLDTFRANNNATNNVDDYFLWATNIAIHKNHINALEALEHYYENGGKYKCVITGACSDYLNPNKKVDKKLLTPYVEELREYISESESLLENLLFKGNMRKNNYKDVVESARFVFHPGYADNGNGNGNVVDAAQVGVPSLVSDYAAMKFMNERMNLCCVFCDWTNPNDIADKIMYMEKNNEHIKNKMPNGDYYLKFSWENQKEKIYSILRQLIRGY